MGTVYKKKKPWRRITGHLEKQIRIWCVCLILLEGIWLSGSCLEQPWIRTEKKTEEFVVEVDDHEGQTTFGLSIHWKEGTIRFYKTEQSTAH
ncbi:MAG: hypothetical protein ACLTKI_06905 [Lachnospiraceae bacterium]